MKKVISLIMSICMLGVQIVPAYSACFKKKPGRIAYLGVHFQDLAEKKRTVLESRISGLLEKEEGLYSVSQEEIQSRLDELQKDRITKQLQKKDLRSAAILLDADYIFAGNIQNQSKNDDYTVLTGSMVRYDHKSDQLYTVRVKGFFENFDGELAKIDRQLIQTIIPEKQKGFFARHLPGIVIVAATVLAISLLVGGTDGQGSGGSGGQRPPFTVQ